MSAGFVSIRQAEHRDEAALRTLWCAAWEGTYPAFDYRARWPQMWQHWEGLGAEIHLAARGRDIIGMLVIAALNDNVMLLEQIALAPAEQGSGTAHLLMAFAKQKTARVLKLSVNAFNRRAIHFYEREGFRRTGSGTNPVSGLTTFDYEWRA